MADLSEIRTIARDLLDAEASAEAARVQMRQAQDRFKQIDSNRELLHKALFLLVGQTTRYLVLDEQIIQIQGLSHGMAYVNALDIEK